MIPELFDHQKVTRDFILDKVLSLVFNDPGTGKTASALAAYQIHRTKNKGGRMLVLAPKAILEPAWCDDCRLFTPRLSIAAAYASNREAAFRLGTDIVVTNHDAVKWLLMHKGLLEGFDFLVIDESTAYKNPTSQRSKAVARLIDLFKYRVVMTGTPIPNRLIDIWHQAYLADKGERLGAQYYRFRAATHEAVPVMAGINTWAEKPGAQDAVVDLLADITVRFKFEDCNDIPENFTTVRNFELPPSLRKHYIAMAQNAVLELQDGEVSAINAAAVTQKLLQIASGAVYTGIESESVTLNAARYDLVAELVQERAHCLVAFQWRHQRDALQAALKKAGITDVAVIDGTTKDTPKIVRDFQAGKYRVLLAQPQSASHGLTLTRATTTIWASPTWDAERFEQFNRRIYRTGQTLRTETILVQAEGTIDERVYDVLRGKTSRQFDLLALIQALSPAMAA